MLYERVTVYYVDVKKMNSSGAIEKGFPMRFRRTCATLRLIVAMYSLLSENAASRCDNGDLREMNSKLLSLGTFDLSIPTENLKNTFYKLNFSYMHAGKMIEIGWIDIERCKNLFVFNYLFLIATLINFVEIFQHICN
ncbi:hypothetical protein ANTQUA_LOCUS4868 [Anthophora quadrimaculata]